MELIEVIMQEAGLLSTLIIFLFILLLLGGEIIVARRFERARSPRPSGQLPYTWGYFCGVQAIILAGLAILGAFISPEIDKSTALMGSILAVVGWGVPGYFVIHRRKWAWITLTILSMNFVLWGINYFYGKNRWNEFDSSVVPAAEIALVVCIVQLADHLLGTNYGYHHHLLHFS